MLSLQETLDIMANNIGMIRRDILQELDTEIECLKEDANEYAEGQISALYTAKRIVENKLK